MYTESKVDYKHKVISNLTLIGQDKSSCLPVHLLRKHIDKSDHVIDSTSAPGNKTLQLTELSEHVTAFEKDENRYV